MAYLTLRYVIIVTMAAFAQSQRRTPLSETCSNDVSTDRRRCYSLYSGDEMNWSQAREFCDANNTRLASIESESEWEDIKDFIREAGAMSGHGVWVAGRRSEDNSWVYVQRTGTRMLNGAFPSDKYCARLSRTGDNTIQESRACVEKNYVVCQHELESSNQDECMMTRKNQDGDDMCLTLIQSPMSWFEARNYCRTQFEDGDLADVQYDISDFPATETSHLELSVYGVWIGLQRRPWVWMLPGNRETPVSSYHFSGQEGSDDKQSCMFVRIDPQGLHWADQDCWDRVKYYICQTDGAVGQDGFNPDATGFGPTTAEKVTNSNTVYIAVAISVVGVASITGVLIFLYVRRRQMIRQKQNEARMRDIRHVTDPDSYPDRPRISSPIPLDAPYPVSGYGNLGPLVPVTPTTSGETQEGGDNMYAEIPGGGSGSPPASGFIMFGDGLTYANVNFAESDPQAMSRDQSADAPSGGDTDHHGSSSSVSHVITENGDEYALPDKVPDDGTKY